MKLLRKIVGWLKSHKIVVSLVVFIILVGVIYLPAKIRAFVLGPEAEYKTTQAQAKDLTQVVDVSGEVKAQNQATLKFQASGKLAWVGVKEGDEVKKWQAIASLDKKTLKKTLEKEVHDYLSERWDFEQSHQDYGSSGLPLDEAILSDAAKRVLEKAQFDLSQTVLDLEIDQIALEVATIYSPIDGIVIDVEAPLAGVNITPATAEFMVADPSEMVFEALIDEADIGLVEVGQKTLIFLDAYPSEEFEGVISRIDFTSTTTRGGGTAFAAEIALPENEAFRFKIGLNGDAEIIIEEKEAVLSLPLAAIQEENGETSVQIIKNKKIEKVTVETGLKTDTRAEILSGLTGDEKVITGKKEKKK